MSTCFVYMFVIFSQVWNGTQYVLNDGPQGLQRLDRVISAAGKYGIKVILAFTNNWFVHSFMGDI